MGVARLHDFAEDFYPQNNGEMSDSITQNWTEQALECYCLHQDCTRCSISKGQYSFVCQMPKIIDILVDLHGEPPSDLIQNLDMNRS